MKNVPFCPISASDSDFNPRNTFRVFLWLKSSPSLTLNKIEHFLKVSRIDGRKNKTQLSEESVRKDGGRRAGEKSVQLSQKGDCQLIYTRLLKCHCEESHASGDDEAISK